jgi:hypothetical protein
MKYKITYSTTESLTLETPEICSISDLNGVAQVMAEQLRKDIKIISWEKLELTKTEKASTEAPQATNRTYPSHHGNEEQSGTSHSTIMPEWPPKSPAPRIGDIS